MLFVMFMRIDVLYDFNLRWFIFIVILGWRMILVDGRLVLRPHSPHWQLLLHLFLMLLLMPLREQLLELRNGRARRGWVHFSSIVIRIIHAFLNFWLVWRSNHSWLSFLLGQPLLFGCLFVNVFLCAWVRLLILEHLYSIFVNFLVKHWIICLISINYNNIDTCHSERRWIIDGIFDKLFLHCDFKASILLLELVNYILHILLNLALFFNLESILCIIGQLWVISVLLLTNEHLQMIKLCRQQIALDGGQLIG